MFLISSQLCEIPIQQLKTRIKTRLELDIFMHQTVGEMSTNNREPELKEDLYIYALRHQTWMVSANYHSVKSKLNVVCAWCQRNSSGAFEWQQVQYIRWEVISDHFFMLWCSVATDYGVHFLPDMKSRFPSLFFGICEGTQQSVEYGRLSKTWLYIARQLAGERQEIVPCK